MNWICIKISLKFSSSGKWLEFQIVTGLITRVRGRPKGLCNIGLTLLGLTPSLSVNWHKTSPSSRTCRAWGAIQFLLQREGETSFFRIFRFAAHSAGFVHKKKSTLCYRWQRRISDEPQVVTTFAPPIRRKRFPTLIGGATGAGLVETVAFVKRHNRQRRMLMARFLQPAPPDSGQPKIAFKTFS